MSQRQRSPDGALCATYGATPCSADYFRSSIDRMSTVVPSGFRYWTEYLPSLIPFRCMLLVQCGSVYLSVTTQTTTQMRILSCLVRDLMSLTTNAEFMPVGLVVIAVRPDTSHSTGRFQMSPVADMGSPTRMPPTSWINFQSR